MTNKWMKRVLMFTLMAGAVFLTACGGTTIPLNDYLEMTYFGFEGYGQAEATLHIDALVDDHLADINPKDVPDGVTNKEYFYDAVRRHVEVNAGDEYELSNGDTVTVTWTVDNQKAVEEDLGIRFEYSDEKIEVTELKDVEEFDAFAGISINVTGTSPNATAVVESDPSALPPLSFEIEPSENLKTGDTVTVRFKEEMMKAMLLSDGVFPIETEKEFTVGDLRAEVTDLSMITEDAWSAMDEVAQDKLYSQINARWDDVSKLEGISHFANYLLVADSEDASVANRLIMLYNVETTDGLSYFTYMQFEDLIKEEDGTIKVDLTDYLYPSQRANHKFDHNGLLYEGYATIEDLYNHRVVPALDEFTMVTDL